MNPPEIKILINAADLIAPSVTEERDALISQAAGIKSVANAEQDNACGLSVTSMRKHVKDLTAERMKRTKILDDAKKLIMDFFGEHLSPLEIEIERLKKLGNNFAELESRRVAEEERIRQEQFQKAQAQQFTAASPVQEMIARRKVENIIATPGPEVDRAKGKTTKQVLKWEVTDLMELVKHNPQLCKIEAKPSAINATCHPNLPVPGLKLWFETESNYTTR